MIQNIYPIILYAFGMQVCVVLDLSIIPLHLLATVLMLYLFRPIYLISPGTIIHLYYVVFFIIAPVFSERHESDSFNDRQAYLIYGMVFLTYLMALNGVRSSGAFAVKHVIGFKFKNVNKLKPDKLILI